MDLLNGGERGRPRVVFIEGPESEERFGTSWAAALAALGVKCPSDAGKASMWKTSFSLIVEIILCRVELRTGYPAESPKSNCITSLAPARRKPASSTVQSR